MTQRTGRNLGLELVRVTEAAALAAGRWVGRSQKEACDAAAVEAMRLILGAVDMAGIVVIGEGEKDAGPRLFNGEAVGTGRGPRMDVAVDPIDGTSLLAFGRPDAIAVIAVAPRGSMWSPGPAFYMSKLVVGRDAREAITPASLDAPVADVLGSIAEAKREHVCDLTVFVIDRPRHAGLIAEVQAAGARLVLRTDGDILGALLAATPNSGIDVLMGIGGTPEGVISACAVRALGGAMLVRLAPQRPAEREAIDAAGMNSGLVLTERDLVTSEDVFFAATGITDGMLMPGVRYTSDGATTDSIVIRGRSGTRRTIHADHGLDKLMKLSSIE
jgi:fructose-1,6-bisphosphatase II